MQTSGEHSERHPRGQYLPRTGEEQVLRLLDASLDKEEQGDITAALALAEQAVTRAEEHGDASDLAAALVRLAYPHFRLGHYDQARALAERALAPLRGPRHRHRDT